MPRWNKELAAELGPNEADGKKLFTAAKAGNIDRVRAILVEIAENPALATLIVIAVRCHGENLLKVKGGDGCLTTKIAADQLLGVLRRTNPVGLKEAETIAVKMEQCEREASQAHQKMEVARVAGIENDGVESAFGWVFGGPCRLIHNVLPAAVVAEYNRLGISNMQYPWTLPEPAYRAPAKPREVRSAAQAMRDDSLQIGLE